MKELWEDLKDNDLMDFACFMGGVLCMIVTFLVLAVWA